MYVCGELCAINPYLFFETAALWNYPRRQELIQMCFIVGCVGVTEGGAPGCGISTERREREEMRMNEEGKGKDKGEWRGGSNREKEKYDLQKMTTRSTEILHVEVEIGKEQIRIVLVYMKTGNHYETKDRNKKITEEIGQILEEREIQQKQQ